MERIGNESDESWIAHIPVAQDEGHPETDGTCDQQVIRDGIESAVRENCPIDHRTARYIAGQLHGGQASALYELASSGAITARAMNELAAERAAGQQTTPLTWIDALIAYCASRPAPGPIADWVEQTEAPDRADFAQRTVGNGTATLSDLAVVQASEPSESPEEERDAFSWSDAAHWSPGDADEAASTALADEQIDLLFESEPDEESGDVDALGRYALIRRHDEPGGIILRRGNDGLTHSWVIPRDELLTTRWAAVVRGNERYSAERQAYEDATTGSGDTASGIRPQIWVGSLADYNAGHLHGEWFDATREASELELATQFMLRGSHMPNAEEWAVMDYDGFGSLRLGEYASFETISRIASGIAEHGEVFAAWVAHASPEDYDTLDRFEDHYRGEWDSFEVYVEDYLQETGFYQFLDQVPEDMRGYIEVDVAQIARDWGSDYEVVERPNGGVWVLQLYA